MCSYFAPHDPLPADFSSSMKSAMYETVTPRLLYVGGGGGEAYFSDFFQSVQIKSQKVAIVQWSTLHFCSEKVGNLLRLTGGQLTVLYPKARS